MIATIGQLRDVDFEPMPPSFIVAVPSSAPLSTAPDATGVLRGLHHCSTSEPEDPGQKGSMGIPPTDKGVHHMARVFAAILLVTVLVIGGGIIATTAYNAGIAAGTTVTTPDGGTTVTPVVVPAYGYGWHPFGWGFGFFGFLFFLFFLFIVFGLIRAIFWRGPGRGGWGGAGWYGPKGSYGAGGSPWRDHAHDTFDDWHRRAHGDAPETGPTDPPTRAGVA
jgi:hypothetical protein